MKNIKSTIKVTIRKLVSFNTVVDLHRGKNIIPKIRCFINSMPILVGNTECERTLFNICRKASTTLDEKLDIFLKSGKAYFSTLLLIILVNTKNEIRKEYYWQMI